MAHIVFYDATEQDREQLTRFLQPTDHFWEYTEDKISLENINPDAEVISVFVSSTVTKEMIAKMPRLRLIACRSTGFNNIDLASAKARDITVTNVPTYGEHTVAEYAFAMLLYLTRKIGPAVAVAQSGSMKHDTLIGTDLAGKTMGIIGCGRIGRNAIKIAKGFDMHVIAYDPYPNEQLANEIGYEIASLEDLLQRSDFISLHAPYSRSSHHIINSMNVGLIKRGAFLVNTARGELVDTSVIVDALQSGRLAGAALDVLEGETLISLDEESVLLANGRSDPIALKRSLEITVLSKMPNVIITNHNAFNTAEAIERINKIAADNIINYWYGTAPNAVHAEDVVANEGGKLVVVRHTESEWNALGVWTGVTDVHLSKKGFSDAVLIGESLKDIAFDFAFHSQQIRTLETLQAIIDATGQLNLKYETAHGLNERDYGDYTGKNKWEIKEQIGEAAFEDLRRGWDVPVPHGETLHDVYNRSVPFYLEKILPLLRDNKNVLIVAHGNSIRSLMKYIENISDEDIQRTEMLFNQAVIYSVDDQGRMVNKSVRAINSDTPKA